jgi:SNF2 family DNA or RNA helicase
MTVSCTTDGSRVLVRFPYDPKLVNRVHKVPGARWHDETKTWRAPLTMDTCRVLRRVFGTQLEILPPLVVWARAELVAEAAMEEIRSGKARARLVRVEKSAPQLALAMDARPYQKDGAAFLSLGRHVLLGDQPGLGKTLQTLAALIETGARRIVVACPRTACRTVWERETARWAPGIETFVAQGTPAHRERVMGEFFISGVRQDGSGDGRQKMLIINTEMIRTRRIWVCPDKITEWAKAPGLKGGCPLSHDHKIRLEHKWPFLFKAQWDAIVMDESHNSLATTKNVQSKGITQVRLGAVLLRKRLSPDAGSLAIALSGTPFRSNLAKAWGTLNWLRPDVFTSFWNFAKTHFEVEQDGYSQTVGREPLDPAAFEAAMRPYFLARTKAEVAKDLPPIVYAGTPPEDSPDAGNYVWLPMEGKQAEAYQKMLEMATVRLGDRTLTANGVLAEITRRRQFACAYAEALPGNEMRMALPSNKLDWILEFLAEREGNDGKVVIATGFTQLVKLFAREIEAAGYQVLTLTGETSDRARADMVERFADPDDPARVAIINMKAGGVAITLDQADDMILVDQPWTSDEEEQVVDRIHRVSRIHNVTVFRLITEGTVDSWMASNGADQRRILLAATEGIREMP